MTTSHTVSKPPWPTHPDGRPKKMGEMTPEQRREQAMGAFSKLKAEMESPEFRKALEEVLSDEQNSREQK